MQLTIAADFTAPAITDQGSLIDALGNVDTDALPDPAPVAAAPVVLDWRRAATLGAGMVISGDGGRFRIDEWEPVLPGSRVAMRLIDLDTFDSFDYTAHWDDVYAVERI
jgi:hypothetical protein